MKFYRCNTCESRGKRFAGTRKEVRHHLKEEHMFKCKRKDGAGEYKASQLTAGTISGELE